MFLEPLTYFEVLEESKGLGIFYPQKKINMPVSCYIIPGAPNYVYVLLSFDHL
jgi:hypothetical protein